MGGKILMALAIPLAYLLITTTLLVRGHRPMPRLLQWLSAHDALFWNTMVGLTIAAGLLRWALAR